MKEVESVRGFSAFTVHVLNVAIYDDATAAAAVVALFFTAAAATTAAAVVLCFFLRITLL